eukprot:TRINITY_DN8521_c0_g1_i1.p1 TRINITY_DN8521_c0_g1~~TRINITY_DN8521_c0_g1_i1.p1  ORF type:complete len:390 (+),score=109.70 TRINITY_DN8521_c0_g1_i1:98-1267(+)
MAETIPNTQPKTEEESLEKAFRNFEEKSKQELEQLRQLGTLVDDKALNRLVARLRSSTRKFKVKKEELSFVKKISGFDRNGALRALILREEIIKAQEKGLEIAEAINELTSRLSKSRITGKKRDRTSEVHSRGNKRRKLKHDTKKSRKRFRSSLENYFVGHNDIQNEKHKSDISYASKEDTVSANSGFPLFNKNKRRKIESVSNERPTGNRIFESAINEGERKRSDDFGSNEVRSDPLGSNSNFATYSEKSPSDERESDLTSLTFKSDPSPLSSIEGPVHSLPFPEIFSSSNATHFSNVGSALEDLSATAFSGFPETLENSGISFQDANKQREQQPSSEKEVENSSVGTTNNNSGSRSVRRKRIFEKSESDPVKKKEKPLVPIGSSQNE